MALRALRRPGEHVAEAAGPVRDGLEGAADSDPDGGADDDVDVLAVVLVGAVTWAALLAVPWLPSIAASVLVGLCLDAIQAAHKRPKHAPRVLAELDHVDPALHVHVNRPGADPRLPHRTRRPR